MAQGADFFPRRAVPLIMCYEEYVLLRLGRAEVVKWNDVHFSNRLLQQCFGNDSDVPRVFVLHFTCTTTPHAQGENLVFDMDDFKASEKAVVLVGTKEVVQPSLNSLLLDFLRFELIHLARNSFFIMTAASPRNSSDVLLAYQ
jgi:hypothetical protein